jgi:predicted nucleic-acid-binding Zn-ribbon protein
MTFACPHCGFNEYRFLAGIDGKTAAQCLKCGRASAFDRWMLSEPPRSPAGASGK